MRLIIAGAEITDAVVDIIEDLQSDLSYTASLKKSLQDLSGLIIEHATETGTKEFDSKAMEFIRTIRDIDNMLTSLSEPPDADDPDNDVPAVEL